MRVEREPTSGSPAHRPVRLDEQDVAEVIRRVAVVRRVAEVCHVSAHRAT